MGWYRVTVPREITGDLVFCSFIPCIREWDEDRLLATIMEE
jgi:hypothetical protein